MRLQLLSDLHLEFHADNGESFIRSLDSSDVDALVVAGDLATRPLLAPALTRLCDRYPRVIYVVGNHEYYGSHPDQVHSELARLDALLPNLDWLHHGTVLVDGVLFAGTPLWFGRSPDSDRGRGYLNDFALIEAFEPWVYDENAEALSLLARVAARASVVVTHHLPSQRSVAPRYAGSPLNAFFVCPCEELIEQQRPPLWLHGHTHIGCDYRLGATRVVCNPLGYPGEPGSTFVEKLVIEVTART